MDRMLVVVFDTEPKAYEGRQALQQLENDGSIAIYAHAVVAKNADGTTTVKQGEDPGVVGGLTGTALGSLLGLLGGPAGLAVGAVVGFVAGYAVDIDRTRIAQDFLEDVEKELLPNKFAVVAEIQENWTTPVDTRMEAIGGKVFRRALTEVKQVVNDEEVAAMKADLAQLKAERAKANADRKIKLLEKINQLDSKIQARLEQNKQRRQAAEAQDKAKVEVLKAKAAALKAKAAATHA
jgi:uncharacterized membrane protein